MNRKGTCPEKWTSLSIWFVHSSLRIDSSLLIGQEKRAAESHHLSKSFQLMMFVKPERSFQNVMCFDGTDLYLDYSSVYMTLYMWWHFIELYQKKKKTRVRVHVKTHEIWTRSVVQLIVLYSVKFLLLMIVLWLCKKEGDPGWRNSSIFSTWTWV